MELPGQGMYVHLDDDVCFLLQEEKSNLQWGAKCLPGRDPTLHFLVRCGVWSGAPLRSSAHGGVGLGSLCQVPRSPELGAAGWRMETLLPPPRHVVSGGGHAALMPGQPRPCLKGSGWDSPEGNLEVWLHCCVAFIGKNQKTLPSSVWEHHRAKHITGTQ